jgi:lysophospholipase L1-like esterase
MIQSRWASAASRRGRAALVVLLGVATLYGVGTPAPAVAAGDASTAGGTAVVSLGDSFISGEAGRWLGNSNTGSGSRDGTDRAYDPTTDTYDPTKVYGSSFKDGCDRSDVAEVSRASLPVKVDNYLNLACSGATTDAIWNSFKGEDPQATQLAAVAAKYKVTAVVLSIGGNDLNISGILRTCAEHFILWETACTADGSAQKQVTEALKATQAKVGKVIQSVRDVMRSAGYSDDGYQFVLQGYPSTLPNSAHVRYGEGHDRYTTGGCPFYNSDLDWVRGPLTSEVGDALKAVAASEKGVDFLDLRDTLAGRELCATTTNLVSTDQPVSLVTSEWSRFVAMFEQGYEQEVLHPNAIAQHALGYCLGLFIASPGPNASCVNTPGEDYRGMKLVR